MTPQSLIRPAWTPATIALMLVGFMIYWPLGFAMLAYILWGDRLELFREDVSRSTDRVFAGLRRSGASTARTGRSGNLAFEAWRKTELERLDEERRKLNETFAEFEAYDRELRRAKDQEAFERFMATRRGGETSGAGSPTIDG